MFVFREIALDAFLLFAAEGRVGEDHIHAVALADVRQLEAERIAGINLRRVEAVQQQVHLAEQIWQRLGFAAEQGFFLQDFAVGHGFDLLGKVVECFDQETARAAGGVEYGFAEARVGDGDHEAHDGARRVKFAGITGSITHFTKHGFVERPQRVQLIAGGEMDAVEFVDDIAQQITANHAVLHTFEHGGDDITPVVTVGTGKRAQVTEQARPALGFAVNWPLWHHSFLVVDEGEQFIAGDAIGLSGPISPAIGWFDSGLELFRGELGLALALNFQVIEELQEHDPGEHRQAVEVAI